MREYDYRQKWTKLLTPEIGTTPVFCWAKIQALFNAYSITTISDLQH